MTDHLTTLMRETARGVHPRLQPPEQLRRHAERRRRARRGAAIGVLAAAGSVIATVTGTGLFPAQQRDWVPAQGNHVVGDWEVTEGPTVRGAGVVTSNCEPAGTKCSGFYVRVTVINRAEVPKRTDTLVATGGYIDGSGEVWRAKCWRPNLPNSARVPKYVQPGKQAVLYCDRAGRPLASMDNVDAMSVKLING